MSRIVHAFILSLFRRRPSLAAELLAEPLGVSIPRALDERVHGVDLYPDVPPEHQPDLVVGYGGGADGLVVALDVRTEADEERRRFWPLWQAALRARLDAPVCVLIATLDADVARWARTPVYAGQPGVVFAPMVLGPTDLPGVSPAEAWEAPERALLAALAQPLSATRDTVARVALRAMTRGTPTVTPTALDAAA